MKRKKLISRQPSIAVYGVSTTLKGYKFCWHLTQILQIDFKKLDEIALPAGTQQSPDCYVSLNKDVEKCYVIENETNGTYYQSKYKIVDFFLVHYRDESLTVIENLKEKIKAIKDVQMVFPIDISKQIDAEAFWIE